MKIFVSHLAESARYAVRFKDLVEANSPATKVYLSSDWESIPSGSIWIQEIEKALSECQFFVVLAIEAKDAKSSWINYEVGFARGRGLLPKIFVFSGVALDDFEFPLKGLFLIQVGDTNRWMLELSQMGVCIPHDKVEIGSVKREFADLFEKKLL